MHYETIDGIHGFAHPLQPFWSLAAANVQAEALVLAIDSGLLQDGGDAQTPAQVAAARGWHPGNTAHWLELLWSMGVLDREPMAATGTAVLGMEDSPRYRASAVARRYLSARSAEDCSAAWLFRLRSLRHASTLLRAQVEHGPAGQGSVAPFAQGNAEGWAAAARAQIGQEQRAVTVPAALEVLRRVPEAARMHHVLDLGGGPGEVALALLHSDPRLQATVFDWPQAVAVAADAAQAAGVSGRFTARGGDLAAAGSAGDIGNGYDLVWCSSVLHFVPDAHAAVVKVFDALVPGGVFVCAHAEAPAAAEAARRVLPYYLPMRLLGRQVLPQGALQSLLSEVGFVQIDVSCSQSFPMAPLTVLVARKPRAGVAA